MSTSRSPPDPLHAPHDNHATWLLRNIWDRVNEQNEHFMGAVVGREGSGKSHTAIRLSSELDSTFSAERVIFDVADLLRVLKDGDHSPGNFYVLDEAGVSLGNRTWQERGQILANQALQLIRDHNLGLFFTLPRLGELDSQAQARLQAFYEITEKEPDEFVRGKWKWMDPDRTDESGTIYKKYPRRRVGGRVKRITSFGFQPPSDKLVEPYEDRKREFQERFYKEALDALEGNDEDDPDEGVRPPKEVAAEIANDGLEQFVSVNSQTGVPYINRDLLRAELGLTQSDARAVKALLERRFSEEELKELA